MQTNLKRLLVNDLDSDLRLFVAIAGYKHPYLIFVTGATGGARVNFFCPV